VTDELSSDSKDGQIRALVVDDDLVIRRGLVSLLDGDGRTLEVREAGGRSQALELAQMWVPDVVLLNLGTPRQESMHALAELSRLYKVLVLASGDVTFDVDQALRIGATGYLVHRQFSASELTAAVLATAQGRAHLSPGAVTALAENLRAVRSLRLGSSRHGRVDGLSRRELEIMEHISRGQSNPEIAKTLFLSEKTVKNHVNRIYAKLQVRSRAAAVALWLGAPVDPD
jgi:DNA-binding NarL/FixJ family response regulator